METISFNPKHEILIVEMPLGASWQTMEEVDLELNRKFGRDNYYLDKYGLKYKKFKREL